MTNFLNFFIGIPKTIRYEYQEGNENLDVKLQCADGKFLMVIIIIVKSLVITVKKLFPCCSFRLTKF